jgi:putative transport protein
VGNSEKKLQEPQLLSIFLGIVLGVLLGSVPIMLPGLSAPVKLGMAAGPLLVALLISRYGGISSIHSFLNQSAILFMKDFGICLFFAAVGIHAGESFYNTFVTYNGWAWIGYGMIVTIVPLLIMLLVARLVFRLNYMPLLGLMSGTYTDPAALAFSTSYFKTDLATQAYATVYPLVTILRILVAQLLVLYFTR